MKKILAGMLYRLFRGFEVWALIALLLFSSFFLFECMNSHDVVNGHCTQMLLGGRETDFDGPEDVREYCYANMDIDVSYAYKYSNMPLEPELYAKIRNSFIPSETEALTSVIMDLPIFPVMLIAIFIPVFFGRMFSDGTIRNLITSGHSRGRIYFTSLLLAMVIDTLMMLISVGMVALLCLYFRWLPPVWLPVDLPLLLLDLFILYIVSALCIAVLFVSKKMTATFAVGFVMFAWVLFPFDATIMAVVIESYTCTANENREFYDNVKEKGMVSVEYSFVLQDYNLIMECDGATLGKRESSLKPAVKNSLIACIYSSPLCASHSLKYYFGYCEYRVTKDGLVGLNLAVDILWMLIPTAAGYLIFRKKELI